jgi:hypothetical protein
LVAKRDLQIAPRNMVSLSVEKAKQRSGQLSKTIAGLSRA